MPQFSHGYPGETMTQPLFGTIGFFEALANLLNGDETWRKMATPITYSMVYIFVDSVDRVFFLNFDKGEISEVVELAGRGQREADFTISATSATWKAVITKEMSPMSAMSSAQLQMDGNRATLLRHMKKFSYMIDMLTRLDPVYE
ncbi:MAG TPA: SCP2 sterol-binding domain-containing protein [Acidimicrobiales bacterium]|nr:SCP2 sterol-binding domain-containing protein [Acidimicrobiales bacterium]